MTPTPPHAPVISIVHFQSDLLVIAYWSIVGLFVTERVHLMY